MKKRKSSASPTANLLVFRFPRALMAVPCWENGITDRPIPNGLPIRRLTLKGCKRPTARTMARNVRRIAFAQAHGLTPYLTMPVPA